jgi:cell division protein FtsI (penicillin-binding protein 3)
VAEQARFEWRRLVRRRVVVIAIGLAAWAVVIEARLVQLQLVDRRNLEIRAEHQQTQRVDLLAQRGEILDRHGMVLARSVDTDSIAAYPPAIQDVDGTIATLCGIVRDCTPRERQVLAERMRRPGTAFVWVRRQVSPDVAKQVAGLIATRKGQKQPELPGVGLLRESRRFYPNRELAAHLLGWVNIDGDGMAGIELTFDSRIGGRKGEVLFRIDGRRNAFDSRVERAPVPGATLELAIDEHLQHIVERELRAGIAANRASAGTALIMDPMSGEILAMASEPTFNPNSFSTAGDAEIRNRAIQDVYEPGSTFKVVTASAAFEEKVLRPTDMIDVSGGAIKIGPRVVRDVHPYGTLSFGDVIVKSSNVGAIKAGLRIGAERLGRYVQRFGFGTRLLPDLPGENAGIVWDPARWNDSTLASVSMGYEISVTPLQMAAAVSSIANGGELIRPHVVRASIDGSTRTEVPRHVIRRTVSPATAAELTTLMEGVVERGTARSAQIPGYTVAGKTGTAKKVVGGQYSREYNASFVGFVPSRRPALTVLVVIDNPRKSGYFGGTVAAPVFKRIAEAALLHLGIGPTVNPVPPVLAARQAPQPGTHSAAAVTAPTVIPALAGGPDGRRVLPELVGLSGREAVRVLARLGIGARVSGDGLVVAQDPPAGTPLDACACCRLSLRRPAVPPSVIGITP